MEIRFVLTTNGPEINYNKILSNYELLLTITVAFCIAIMQSVLRCIAKAFFLLDIEIKSKYQVWLTLKLCSATTDNIRQFVVECITHLGQVRLTLTHS